MTINEVPSEAQFLGNDAPELPRRVYARRLTFVGGNRRPVDKPRLITENEATYPNPSDTARQPAPATPEEPQLVEMLLEAEKHATTGLLRLQNAELDAGIAFLQSALAFAQNYRHALRTPEADQ